MSISSTAVSNVPLLSIQNININTPSGVKSIQFCFSKLGNVVTLCWGLDAGASGPTSTLWGQNFIIPASQPVELPTGGTVNVNYRPMKQIDGSCIIISGGVFQTGSYIIYIDGTISVGLQNGTPFPASGLNWKVPGQSITYISQ